MKKQLLLLTTLLLIGISSFAQKLTLSELISLCNRQNWESVNSALLAKGWVYHDSNKGDGEHYNTIIWSYNKDYYTDKAQGWFYLYTYEGYPNKISFTVFNKAAYIGIQNSLASAGFKLSGSAIEDGEVVSTYANNSHIIKVNTQKREDDDWSDRSLTAYDIIVIKKAGVYDPDNGKKVSYYDDGIVQMEYNLKNGELQGLLEAYHENGRLKKKGYYVEGKGNGKFTEYDEDGNKTADYTLANNELQGIITIYEDGSKSIEKEYVNGRQTGRYAQYYYDDETGALNLKIVGATKNGARDGKWTTYFVENGEEEMVEFRHYKNGIKHGQVQEFVGSDTIETAAYINGKLHGLYNRQVKIAFTNSNTGESDYVWVKDCEGSYLNGDKSGKWTYFDWLGKLSEGQYSNGLEEGKWVYYTPIGKRDGTVMVESNFVAGQKNGLQKRFYFIDRVETSESSDEVYYKLLPVNEISNYKNDIINGDYELRDSTNVLVSKGKYVNGERHGLWIEGFLEELPSGYSATLYYKGVYNNGKEEGKWVAYFDESIYTRTLNYKDGKLDGEYIVWSKDGKPSEKKNFKDGKFKELIKYDGAGEKILSKYEIFDENSSSLMCRKTDYFNDKTVSQDYKIFRQNDINHHQFERIFLGLTGITSTGVYGYKDGEYKVVDLKGNPIFIGHFLKEDKIGEWVYYYPEQNVKVELSFNNNLQTSEKYFNFNNQLFSGEFVYNNSETGLKEERKVKSGLRNGKTVYLDSNNKTVKKENYKDGVLK
jgi:antitoxin component YwqK of YwqJK toxin-antitoxin module